MLQLIVQPKFFQNDLKLAKMTAQYQEEFEYARRTKRFNNTNLTFVYKPKASSYNFWKYSSQGVACKSPFFFRITSQLSVSLIIADLDRQIDDR